MNSLYTKVFLWLLLTIAISLVGWFGTAYFLSGQGPAPQDFVSRVQEIFVAQAASAYESGGKAGLRSYIEQHQHSFAGRHHLADASYHDLLTGADLSPLLARVRTGPRRRPLFPGFSSPPSFVIHRASVDGRYHWFTEVNPPASSQNQSLFFLWLLIPIAAFSTILAYRIVAPLRRLEAAVEHFGQGDLSARVGWTRTDELGRLGASFDQMASRIETLLTAERRLLQDVSHELRSPLARLRFAVELNDAPRIRKEIDRLTSLVQTLIEVTRAEGDPTARHFLPVDLAALLRDIVEDARIEAGSRHCELQIERVDPTQISGDTELLRRAIDNVLRNAIHHAPENSAIEISLARINGHSALAVRDHGPGVPADLLDRIFQPFVRAEEDRGRANGGVGLGLSITRRAVELHHGRVYAQNAHPGLRVTIEL